MRSEMERLFEMMEGNDKYDGYGRSIYNPKLGLVVIPDEGGEGDEFCRYGYMIAHVPIESVVSELRGKYDTVEEFALCTIPAPGTGMSDRMAFISSDESLARELLEAGYINDWMADDVSAICNL